MKKIKVFMAVILSLLLLTAAAMAGSYKPITPSSSTPVTHTLTLTNSDSLLYDITYTFNVGELNIVQPTDITDPASAITGKPSIKPLEYTSTDTFTDRKCQKNLEIDWSGVSISEPGVYRWQVKTTETDNAPENASNLNETMYLYVCVIDNGGTLSVAAIGLAKDEALTKKENLNDQFPATVANLSLSKTVTGNQGSKDQYFKYTIKLTAPAGAAEHIYTISGTFDEKVPKTAYNEETENPKTVKLSGGNAVSFDIWLKDSQNFKVEELPYGTKYEITESANTGYEVSAKINDIESITGSSIPERQLENDTSVAYTNKKDAEVPTGITVESGAAVMGMLLSAALLALVFAPKRREEKN